MTSFLSACTFLGFLLFLIEKQFRSIFCNIKSWWIHRFLIWFHFLLLFLNLKMYCLSIQPSSAISAVRVFSMVKIKTLYPLQTRAYPSRSTIKTTFHGVNMLILLSVVNDWKVFLMALLLCQPQLVMQMGSDVQIKHILYFYVTGTGQKSNPTTKYCRYAVEPSVKYLFCWEKSIPLQIGSPAANRLTRGVLRVHVTPFAL